MDVTGKKISRKWLIYHLLSFIEILLIFHPFRFQSKRPPLFFRPGSPFITFIFALVILLIILLPVILFIGNAINGFFIPELFIGTAFGLVFGTIVRYVQGESCSYITYQGKKLTLIQFTFWAKKTLKFEKNELIALVYYKHNFHGTKNHKISLLVKDGILILLNLTIFKKKAQRLVNEYSEVFKLKQVEKPGNTNPVNDLNIKF